MGDWSQYEETSASNDWSQYEDKGQQPAAEPLPKLGVEPVASHTPGRSASDVTLDSSASIASPLGKQRTDFGRKNVAFASPAKGPMSVQERATAESLEQRHGAPLVITPKETVVPVPEQVSLEGAEAPRHPLMPERSLEDRIWTSLPGSQPDIIDESGREYGLAPHSSEREELRQSAAKTAAEAQAFTDEQLKYPERVAGNLVAPGLGNVAAGTRKAITEPGHRAEGVLEAASGAMEAPSMVIGPGLISGNAGTALGLATGMATGYGARKSAEALDLSPESQAFAEQIGMFAPALIGHVMGKPYEALPKEPTARSAAIFENLVNKGGQSLPKNPTYEQAATAYKRAANNFHPDVNPEMGMESRLLNAAWSDLKANGYFEQSATSEVPRPTFTTPPQLAGEISRAATPTGSVPAGPAAEAPRVGVEEASPIVEPLPEVAQTSLKAAQAEAKAKAILNPVPAVPEPVAKTEPVTGQVITQLTEAVQNAPEGQRDQAIAQAHDAIAESLVEHGKAVVDGQVYTVGTPQQAASVAAKIVNEAVKKADAGQDSKLRDQRASGSLPTESVAREPKPIRGPAEFPDSELGDVFDQVAPEWAQYEEPATEVTKTSPQAGTPERLQDLRNQLGKRHGIVNRAHNKGLDEFVNSLSGDEEEFIKQQTGLDSDQFWREVTGQQATSEAAPEPVSAAPSETSGGQKPGQSESMAEEFAAQFEEPEGMEFVDEASMSGQGSGTKHKSNEELARQQRKEEYFTIAKNGDLTRHMSQPDGASDLKGGAIVKLLPDGTYDFKDGDWRIAEKYKQKVIEAYGKQEKPSEPPLPAGYEAVEEVEPVSSVPRAANSGASGSLPTTEFAPQPISRDEALAIRKDADAKGKNGPDTSDRVYDLLMPQGEYVRVRVPIDKLSHDPDGADVPRVKEYAGRSTEAPPINLSYRGNRPRVHPGKAYVDDGNHRVQAAIARGETSIDAIMPKSEYEKFKQDAVSSPRSLPPEAEAGETALVPKQGGDGKHYIHLAGEGAPTLNVRVNSADQASAAMQLYRDKYGLGSSTLGEGAGAIFDPQGKQIGHVSYNGRVWEGRAQDWSRDTQLLQEAYDFGKSAPKQLAQPAASSVAPEPKAAISHETEQVEKNLSDEKLAEFRATAEPMRDIKRKETGWLTAETQTGAVLIHPTENKVIAFRAKDQRSGTGLQRARAEAQAYAMDNPIEPKPAKEPWQMTLPEWMQQEHNIQRTGPDMRYVRPNGSKILWPGTTSRQEVKRKQWEFEVKEAHAAGKDVPADVLADAGIEVEKPEPTTKYKYGNTQATIPDSSEAGKAIEQARRNIADADLMSDGKDIGGNHVTVRYGINSDDVEGIKSFLEKQAPFEATLGKLDAFNPSEHSDGAAPIIAPVDAPELHRIEKELDAHGDFIERSFPEYKPHATIAYVKPEAASKYKGSAVTAGKKFTVDTIAISDRNGNTIDVKLKGTAPPAESERGGTQSPVAPQQNVETEKPDTRTPAEKKFDEIVEAGKSETPFEGGKVVENTTLNRIQIVYDQRPGKELHAKLRKSGFVWAPSKNAYQRQLNANGRAAAERVTGIKLGHKAAPKQTTWREAYDANTDVFTRKDILKAVANNRGGKSTPEDLAEALKRLESIVGDTGAYDIAYDIAHNPAAKSETIEAATNLYHERYPETEAQNVFTARVENSGVTTILRNGEPWKTLAMGWPPKGSKKAYLSSYGVSDADYEDVAKALDERTAASKPAETGVRTIVLPVGAGAKPSIKEGDIVNLNGEAVRVVDADAKTATVEMMDDENRGTGQVKNVRLSEISPAVREETAGAIREVSDEVLKQRLAQIDAAMAEPANQNSAGVPALKRQRAAILNEQIRRKDYETSVPETEPAVEVEAEKPVVSESNASNIAEEATGAQPEDQSARAFESAEDLSSVSEPARQSGNPSAAVPTEGNGEAAPAEPSGASAGQPDRERVELPARQPRQRNEPARSRGNRPADDTAAERAGGSPAGEGTTGADGRAVESSTPETTQPAKDTAAKLRNQRNFHISDEYASQIGSGGEITKIKGNLDALETLKTIQKEGRELATPEEQQALAKYVDFGGLVGMLQNSWKPEYKEHYRRFNELLTPEEIQEIRETLPNTHYTSMEMVDWMWKAMQRLGFKGGRVLEPGMGIGNFIGRMPEKIAQRAEILGVERNPLTGQMARLLYPDANIVIKPFQQFQVPDNTLDAVIGNVPFQDVDITDDPIYRKLKLNLHNYFIVKALDKVRPGGVVAVITSRYTMDNSTGKGIRAREEMAKRADLLAAIRLPDKAFKGNAGTEVVADLLVFQKRVEAPAEMPSWTKLAPVTVPGEAPKKASAYGREYIENASRTEPKEFMINQYFVDNPDNVLGTHSQTGKMYGPGQYNVTAPEDFSQRLKDAMSLIPEKVYGKIKQAEVQAAPETLDPGNIEFAPEDVKPGAFFKDAKGNIRIKQSGVSVKLPDELKSPEKQQHISKAIDLRDQLNQTIKVQLESADDEPLKQEQQQLKKLYDEYRKKYGSLHGPKLKAVFGDDPEYPKLLALENLDTETKEVSQAAIFTKRVLAPYEPLRDLPDNPKAAMLKVIAERGYLDTKLMAELLGQPENEVSSRLENEGLIFRDPQDNRFYTADEYLSGNVRDKLRLAKNAADSDPAFKRNVEALTAAQPKPLTIHDIQPNLGQTWIPTEIYKGFIAHLAGGNVRGLEISRDSTGKWLVQIPSGNAPFDLVNKWAGGGIAGHKLVQYALNQQQPTVYYKDEHGNSKMDAQATTAAREKLAAIKEEFRTVLRKARKEVVDNLETIYNDTFNSYKLREFSGEHLDFPGMSEDWRNKIRGYQKAAVWRILQDGRAGVFHAPGLGKTLTMISAGMEARRLKLSRKNLYAVPNHMIPQWREDFKRFYPNASVLAVTDEDFTPTNRAKLMSRIATGDWDAVIVPHSQFDLLPMSPEWEKKTIDKRLAEYREVLEDLDEKEDKRTIKQIEKAIDKLESRLNDLNAKKKDVTIAFDQLGVDLLFVDEAHLYKSMAVPSRMGNIGGISNSASQRAFALEMKSDFMRETHKGRGIVFGTGTPITNTVGELYIMNKYLAPEMLEAAGIRSFDDWAANFATTVTQWEYAADGVTFKPKTTLSEFVNVPELSTMFRRFGEYLSKEAAKKLANMKLPEVTRKDHMVKITPTQEPLLQWIADRGDHLTKHPPRTKEERQADNWLKLSGDARKISLDPRLYNPKLKDDPNSKANECVRVILEELKETEAEKGTVAVFSDFFQHKNERTGKADFNLYEDMRNKLVKNGVKRDQIAIIHEAGDDKEAKEAMFAKVRAGKVRVIFGSTEKMGIGTNIQDRMFAEHHLDQPWRPDQVEQREGRIERSGNMWKEVRIHRYIAEPEEGMQKVWVVDGESHNLEGPDKELGHWEEKPRPRAFDLQMYQQLARKASFQEQFLTGNFNGRSMEDVGGEVRLNSQMFELAKAMATGNPDALRKIKLEHDLRTLELLERNFQVEQSRQYRNAENLEIAIPIKQKKIQNFEKASATFKKAEQDAGKDNPVTIQVGDVTIASKEAREKYLKSEPDIQNLVGKKITIGGLDTTLEVEASTSYDPVTRARNAVAEYSYNLAGQRHVLTYDKNGKTHVSTLFASFITSARNLPKWIEQYKQEVGEDQQTLEKLREELKTKSPYRERVDKMTSEIADIDKRLGVKGSGDVDEGAETEEESSEKPAKKVSVKLQITKADEAKLKELGYSQEQIDHLKPEEAQALLNDEPITMGMSVPGVNVAADELSAFYKADIEPALQKAGGSLKDVSGWAIRWLYPRIEESSALGRALGISVPRNALDSLMELKGRRVKNEARFELATQELSKLFDKMSELQRVEFIARMQEGVEQENPLLEQVAEQFRKIMEVERQMEEQAANLDRKGQELSLARKENYFPNRWKRKPGSEEAEDDQLTRIASIGRRPLEGSKSYNKKQTYSLRSGMEAGGVAVTTNPVKVLAHRLADGMQFVTARTYWHELKQLGLRKYVKGMHSKTPEGFIEVPDPIARVMYGADLAPETEGEPGRHVTIEPGRWVIEANAGRVLLNYLSKDHIRSNAVGRGLMGLKNVSTALELSLSPYHAVFETLEAASSNAAVGMMKIWNQGVKQGNMSAALSGVKDLLTAPVSPVQMAREGAALPAYIAAKSKLNELGKELKTENSSKLTNALNEFREVRQQKAVQKLLKQYPDLDQLIDDAFTGGLILGVHPDYQTKTEQSIREAWSSGNHVGAILRAIPNANQTLMHPLFQVYIPALKYGFFLKQMSQQLEERADDLASGKITRAELARQVVDATENRFGELNFDNLFWQKTMKTALQFLFRSVTWKLGNVREFGGAVIGQSKEAGHSLKSLGNWMKAAVKQDPSLLDNDLGEERTSGEYFREEVLPKLNLHASWVLSLAMLTAILGSIASRLFSGKYPWQWADDDAKTGKGPVASTYLEMVHPRVGEMDSRGKPVRLSLPTYWKDVEHASKSPTKYVLSSLSSTMSRGLDLAQNEDYFGNYVYNPNAGTWEKIKQGGKYAFPMPFSVNNYLMGRQHGDPTMAALASIGFPKAPRDLDWTKAESLTDSLLRARAPKQTPEQQQEFLDKLKRFDEGHMTRAERHREQQRRRLSWLQYRFKSLTYKEAKQVMDVASSEERQALRREYQVKRDNALRKAHSY